MNHLRQYFVQYILDHRVSFLVKRYLLFIILFIERLVSIMMIISKPLSISTGRNVFPERINALGVTIGETM